MCGLDDVYRQAKENLLELLSTESNEHIYQARRIWFFTELKVGADAIKNPKDFFFVFKVRNAYENDTIQRKIRAVCVSRRRL